MGEELCIDETSLSQGELYTILSNSSRGCKKGSIIAIVKGTKAETVIKAIEKIRAKLRHGVTKIALDLSQSMALIAKSCFPNAIQVIDRFHVQKLINEAVQDTRVQFRWWAQSIDSKTKQECKSRGEKFRQTIFDNGETISQLFVRARYALMKDKGLWSESQKERMEILFNNFPEIEVAYNISQEFRKLMNRRKDLDDIKKAYESYVYNQESAAKAKGIVPYYLTEQEYILAFFKTKLAIWFDFVDKNDPNGYFKSVKDTFQSKHEKILNYFIDGFSNAKAESLNAKIKDFRRRLKGVKNKTFFLFRLANLLA
ncbi:MAG: transposase [Rikenellaceae bacterium]